MDQELLARIKANPIASAEEVFDYFVNKEDADTIEALSVSRFVIASILDHERSQEIANVVFATDAFCNFSNKFANTLLGDTTDKDYRRKHKEIIDQITERGKALGLEVKRKNHEDLAR